MVKTSIKRALENNTSSRDMKISFESGAKLWEDAVVVSKVNHSSSSIKRIKSISDDIFKDITKKYKNVKKESADKYHTTLGRLTDKGASLVKKNKKARHYLESFLKSIKPPRSGALKNPTVTIYETISTGVYIPLRSYSVK
jgi:uncharacterized protein YktB (UPF0637 family)